ncbi:type I restriction-modification system subunit M N-terminal domain-containing protein [Helcococcus ovis]|uniref:type I restriction-modification system subunit M N-terminal domain-containing protein n=1 Tax=Helcococcus ovis TaxID=72026 RepID=UPI0038BCCEEC
MSQKSLYQSLWNAADVLRSKMDANEYKNYLLGIIFYKYLSDKLLYRVSVLLEQETHDLAEAQKIYEEALNDEEIKQDLLDELKDQYSYVIKPEYTFTQLMQTVEDKVFQLEDLQDGFNDIEKADALFENLFEDIDLYSKKLGSTPNKQNQTISQIMKELKDLNFSEYSGDVLGDAYEYLIGQFASESGKKAGEFYTPHQVSDLMARIVIQGKEDKKGFTVYDPTMGFRVIIMTEANSSVKSKVLKLLPKLKTEETDGLCVA